MLNEKERVRLSKKIAGLLRHFGTRYGLKIDKEGWVKIDELLQVVNSMPGFEWVRREHIIEIVRRDDKERYEIKGNYVRAKYGHSIQGVYPSYTEVENPPETLYHGTPIRNLEKILRMGLLPLKRHWVHLSLSPQMAIETGARYGKPVVLLEINTSCLKNKNIKIYKATNIVFLVDHVPPECIQKTNILNP